MKTVFADSSFFIAFLSEKDEAHPAARDTMNEQPGRIITTHWVLSEVGNWSATYRRADFAPFVGVLRADRRFQIRPPSISDFNAGMNLFHDRPDKNWSLVDCVSFAVMTKLRIKDALSTDHHFRQAGFRVLL